VFFAKVPPSLSVWMANGKGIPTNIRPAREGLGANMARDSWQLGYFRTCFLRVFLAKVTPPLSVWMVNGKGIPTDTTPVREGPGASDLWTHSRPLCYVGCVSGMEVAVSRDALKFHNYRVGALGVTQRKA
jgi:hypothetical protein